MKVAESFYFIFEFLVDIYACDELVDWWGGAGMEFDTAPPINQSKAIPTNF